ncbi:hypothetical protein ASF44_11380 [Pseudorhodoferax sp. Leaf274]|nr:hypothetical protein ASF44_11380 [Pseudorhodoferax sp. Leaf274]
MAHRATPARAPYADAVADLPPLRQAADGTRPALSIIGTTDVPIFLAVLRAYQQQHPSVAIRYEEFSTQGLYDHMVRDRAQAPAVDMLVSSSMDLQARLVNDGYAQPHQSAETAAVPAWARWRNEVFGFSAEPLVMAYDTRRFADGTAPTTRQALLELLRDPARPLARRVGTYDLQASGIGYLAATQDARIDAGAGALLAALVDNQALRAEHASQLLDAVAAGRIAIAYNLPASYVQARIAAGEPIGMVLPRDYTLVLARTAIVPRSAPHVQEAKRFLDYLLSRAGQQVLAQQARILPIRDDVAAAGRPAGPLRPIPLGPGLLVYQDRRKRERFLQAWAARPPA